MYVRVIVSMQSTFGFCNTTYEVKKKLLSKEQQQREL